MKLKALTLLIVIAAASISLPAQAQPQIPAPTNNWVAVGQDTRGTVIMVDAGSLQRGANSAEFWSAFKRKDGSIDLGYAIASCHRNSISPVWEMTIQNDRVVESKSSTTPTFSVIPGSSGDRMYSYVCHNNNITTTMLQNLADRNNASAEAINRAIESGARIFSGR